MKTKKDAIVDKLLSVESWAYRARHTYSKEILSPEEERKLIQDIRMIMKSIGELWFAVNTTGDKGKAWGWWE